MYTPVSTPSSTATNCSAGVPTRLRIKTRPGAVFPSASAAAAAAYLPETLGPCCRAPRLRRDFVPSSLTVEGKLASGVRN